MYITELSYIQYHTIFIKTLQFYLVYILKEIVIFYCCTCISKIKGRPQKCPNGLQCGDPLKYLHLFFYKNKKALCILKVPHLKPKMYLWYYYFCQNKAFFKSKFLSKQTLFLFLFLNFSLIIAYYLFLCLNILIAQYYCTFELLLSTGLPRPKPRSCIIYYILFLYIFIRNRLRQ